MNSDPIRHYAHTGVRIPIEPKGEILLAASDDARIGEIRMRRRIVLRRREKICKMQP